MSVFEVAEHFHAGYREPRPPIFADSLILIHHYVSVDVNERGVDCCTDRFQEHALCMLNVMTIAILFPRQCCGYRIFCINAVSPVYQRAF